MVPFPNADPSSDGTPGEGDDDGTSGTGSSVTSGTPGTGSSVTSGTGGHHAEPGTSADDGITLGGRGSGAEPGPKAVCVFCSSSTAIDSRYLDLAARVGQEFGRRGWVLVSGAGSISAMGALARAARGAGAHTVGVIPEALMGYEVADEDADELIVTADMRERKGIMDARADAFLVLPGGIGTLEEFLEAWVGLVLGMHSKPVVLLDPWDDYRLLHELIAHLVSAGFLRAEVAGALIWTADVSEACDRIEQWWQMPPAVARPGHLQAEMGLEAD